MRREGVKVWRGASGEVCLQNQCTSSCQSAQGDFLIQKRAAPKFQEPSKNHAKSAQCTAYIIQGMILRYSFVIIIHQSYRFDTMFSSHRYKYNQNINSKSIQTHTTFSPNKSSKDVLTGDLVSLLLQMPKMRLMELYAYYHDLVAKSITSILGPPNTRAQFS